MKLHLLNYTSSQTRAIVHAGFNVWFCSSCFLKAREINKQTNTFLFTQYCSLWKERRSDGVVKCDRKLLWKDFLRQKALFLIQGLEKFLQKASWTEHSFFTAATNQPHSKRTMPHKTMPIAMTQPSARKYVSFPYGHEEMLLKREGNLFL